MGAIGFTNLSPKPTVLDLPMLRRLLLSCLVVLAGTVVFSPLAQAKDQVTASWYGDKYHGRPTASGEIFNAKALTAAHPSLPLGSEVEVRRLDNGRVVRVRINDRCGRCGIDLSRAAADQLDLRRAGRALVALRVLGKSPRLS